MFPLVIAADKTKMYCSLLGRNCHFVSKGERDKNKCIGECFQYIRYIVDSNKNTKHNAKEKALFRNNIKSPKQI